jgi:hypothetical protein
VNGNYFFDAPGLTAEECTVFRVNTARSSMIVGNAQWLGIMHKYGGDVVTAWPTIEEVWAGEECAATVGDVMLGTGCDTWSTPANDTHAAAASGKMPKTHVVGMLCIDNKYRNKNILKKINPATNPAVKATALGNLFMIDWFTMQLGQCGPVDTYSKSIGGLSCAMDAPATAAVNFGNQDLTCCEAAHTVAAAEMQKAGSPAAAHASAVEFCPSTSEKHGQCDKGTVKPTKKAMKNSADTIMENGCACGASIMAGLSGVPAELKSAMDADADNILDACSTTTTTTTTVGKSSDSDSGAAGLTAGFSALLVAAFAAVF